MKKTKGKNDAKAGQAQDPEAILGSSGRAQSGRGGDSGARPVPGSQQEGSVDSVGVRPEGKDTEDRTGSGGVRAGTSSSDKGRDNFMSSELRDAATPPGVIDSKTRS